MFAALAVLLAVGAVVGMALLWPNGHRNEGRSANDQRRPPQQADVTKVERVPCTTPQAKNCRQVTAEQLLDGPRQGSDAVLVFGDTGPAPDINVGDHIRVIRNEVPAGAPAGSVPPYSFQDFERRAPMLWLAILFAGLVLLFGRVRGLLSLVGLGLSLAGDPLLFRRAGDPQRQAAPVLDGRSSARSR